MCLIGGAVTARAPAGQAAAGRAARRQTVIMAATPDPGAAQTPIPLTSGQVLLRNTAKLPTQAGTQELVQVRLLTNVRITFGNFSTLAVTPPR